MCFERSLAVTLMALACVPALCQPSDETRLIEIARSAVTSEVTHTPWKSPAPEGTAQPVFVTIEINGVVRGCRGDLDLRRTSLSEEVALAARGAATHDPRYTPLTAKDLKSFLVTVTLVDALRPIENVQGLRPADGLVLTSGNRKGIVLPWEGKDPMTRLKWAYKKAGVPETASVKLELLVARRFRG
jgi:uncharacterized protein